jgi:hypothetical protein
VQNHPEIPDYFHKLASPGGEPPNRRGRLAAQLVILVYRALGPFIDESDAHSLDAIVHTCRDITAILDVTWAEHSSSVPKTRTVKKTRAVKKTRSVKKTRAIKSRVAAGEIESQELKRLTAQG